MRNRIVFLLICLASFAALLACSSYEASPLPVSTVDAARQPAPDVAVTPADAGELDAARECGSPAKVFSFGDGGLFCPFSSTDGGKNLYCTSGSQECCVTPQSAGTPSTCETRDAGCPVANSTILECGHPEDCNGGKCCAWSSTGSLAFLQDVCGPYLSKFTGTRCEASCGAGELTVCGGDQDCTGGATCVAVKPKGNNTGVCVK